MTRPQIELYLGRIGKMALVIFFVAGFVSVWGNGFGVMDLAMSTAVYGGGFGLMVAFLFSVTHLNLMGPKPIRATLGFCLISMVFSAMIAGGGAVILNRSIPVSEAEARVLSVSSLSPYRGKWIVYFVDKRGNQYSERFEKEFKLENPVGTQYMFYIRRGLFGQEFYERYQRLPAPSNSTLDTDASATCRSI